MGIYLLKNGHEKSTSFEMLIDIVFVFI